MAGPVNDGDQYVTRAELRQDLDELRAELRADMKEQFKGFRSELALDIARAMNYVAEKNGERIDELRDGLSRLRTELFEVKDDLSSQIARAARASAEQSRDEMRAMDDRYRELPGRIATLERDLTEHREDEAIHRKRPKRRR